MPSTLLYFHEGTPRAVVIVGLSLAVLVLAVWTAILGLRLRGTRREAERLRRLAVRHSEDLRTLRQADGAVLEHLPDPLIVLDAQRNVRRTNAAARAAFGAELGAVLRHPGLRGAIDRALATGTAQAADLSLPVPVPREVHAALAVLDPPLGDGGRVLAVLSDRTRDRALDRMRADFVANASHELRTPLASLIGFIDTLRGPAADDPSAQRRFLAIMAEQAARMTRLIDDLLSLSRIELTEHQPPADSVDLGTLIPPLAAAFEPRLAEHGARLALDLPDGLPAVTADADQIAQVVQNLLDNALIHGPSGGTVRLAAGPAAAGGRWPGRPGVVVTVANGGPAISRADLPRLTERFYRVDKARSREAGGTGLGLAIVKHIVGRHRGQLLIESEDGKGTVVSVWLPCAQAGATRSAGG